MGAGVAGCGVGGGVAGGGVGGGVTTGVGAAVGEGLELGLALTDGSADGDRTATSEAPGEPVAPSTPPRLAVVNPPNTIHIAAATKRPALTGISPRSSGECRARRRRLVYMHEGNRLVARACVHFRGIAVSGRLHSGFAFAGTMPRGRSGGTGRRGGLKLRCPQGRQGSSPCSGTISRGRVDLYRSKSGIVAALDPVVEALARRQVSPDAVTLAAVPVAALAAACLFGSPSLPGLLLAVPVLAGARLVLNLLDGALARRTERMHPRGELYNELGDRVADVLFLAPVAFLPGADMATVLVGVLLAVLASYVGVASRAAGGRRIYRGILSKPGRMVLLGVFAIVVLVSGSDAWGVFGVVLLAGASVTFVERIVIAIRELP